MFDPITRNVIDRVRPRANQTHLPFEHIEKLGKLIKAVSAQPAPKRSDSRVVRDFEKRTTSLISMAKAVFQIVSIADHGTEFVTIEGLPFAACAKRGVQCRSCRT